MKVFYAARVARYDLLRAVGNLARYITKWIPECDRRLHRLMCYIKGSLKHRMVGWVGDDITKINMDLYADANYGTNGGKSTTGVQLNVEGPHTCFPISALSAAQTSVAHSTPEAEIVAGATALRKVGIPSMVIWEKMKSSADPWVPDPSSKAAAAGDETAASATASTEPPLAGGAVKKLSARAKKSQLKKERKHIQQL